MTEKKKAKRTRIRPTEQCENIKPQKERGPKPDPKRKKKIKPVSKTRELQQKIQMEEIQKEAAEKMPKQPYRPMGWSKRPYTEEDFKQFEGMCQIHCTVDEIISIFDTTKQVLYNHVETYYGQPFGTIYEAKKANGKMSIRRAQYKKAMEGNTTMLIWVGKQWLGQGDIETTREGDKILVFQTKIGPGGQVKQEIKDNEDWEKSKTFSVSKILESANDHNRVGTMTVELTEKEKVNETDSSGK